MKSNPDLTVQEMASYVGQRATLYVREGQIKIPVKIVDIRENYGRYDAKVIPVHGGGETWVNLDRLRLRWEERV